MLGLKIREVGHEVLSTCYTGSPALPVLNLCLSGS